MRRRVRAAAVQAIVAALLLAGCADVGTKPAPRVPAGSPAPVRPATPPGGAPAAVTGATIDSEIRSAGDTLNQLDSQLNSTDQAPADAD
jgi:hypothetical protein